MRWIAETVSAVTCSTPPGPSPATTIRGRPVMRSAERSDVDPFPRADLGVGLDVVPLAERDQTGEDHVLVTELLERHDADHVLPELRLDRLRRHADLGAEA